VRLSALLFTLSVAVAGGLVGIGFHIGRAYSTNPTIVMYRVRQVAAPAAICYTTDGSEPRSTDIGRCSHGALFTSGTISLQALQTLKFIAAMHDPPQERNLTCPLGHSCEWRAWDMTDGKELQ
jgi:hypothetical protein